jgi:hypothetical protein
MLCYRQPSTEAEFLGLRISFAILIIYPKTLSSVFLILRFMPFLSWVRYLSEDEKGDLILPRGCLSPRAQNNTKRNSTTTQLR